MTDIFNSALKINSLPDFVLGDAPAQPPINPCADSMHGSSSDLPALHQRRSASSSSSHNEVRQPPPLSEILKASEQQLSEVHHSEPTVENFTSPKSNN